MVPFKMMMFDVFVQRPLAMRSYPQPEFSLAKRTMSASSSGAMRGRPGEVSNLEPSNLRAMSRRYQARMVSDLATQATWVYQPGSGG